MKWRKIDSSTSETSTGWRVYRAKLPHDCFFVSKGKARFKVCDREAMLHIVRGGAGELPKDAAKKY